jgi:hypothetical protein
MYSAEEIINDALIPTHFKLYTKRENMDSVRK